MEWLFNTSVFVLLFHISNLMAFLAFLLRDQLQLRMLMAVSLFLQGFTTTPFRAGRSSTRCSGRLSPLAPT